MSAGDPASPADLTARARPKARPEAARGEPLRWTGIYQWRGPRQGCLINQAYREIRPKTVLSDLEIVFCRADPDGQEPVVMTALGLSLLFLVPCRQVTGRIWPACDPASRNTSRQSARLT